MERVVKKSLQLQINVRILNQTFTALSWDPVKQRLNNSRQYISSQCGEQTAVSGRHIKSYITKSGEATTLDKEWFEAADLYQGERLVRRGRPIGSGTKTPVTIRLDKEIVDQFKETGTGWQTRMNNALRDWLKRHSPAKL